MAPGHQTETSLLQREQEGFEAKTAIARWAADQVQPEESILLDAGSTVALLARRLPTLEGVTVTTASMPVMSMLDRKSTRLNSSHVAISYAVFCLKKKTHT